MDVLALNPLTANFVKAGFAAGTTSTVSTTATLQYTIRGKSYSKAAITNQATPTTDAATGKAFVPVPASSASIFVCGFNAAGTLLCCQGSVVPLNAQTGNTYLQAPQQGGYPLDFCPFGYLLILAASNASSTPGWLFGTNNMSAVTGITYTFVDVSGIFDRPQTS